jgi:hypothetical protein
MSEEELTKRLTFSLIGIVAIVSITVLSLFFFAPQIGFLFGLISRHRNEEGYKPTAKIIAPILSNLPKSVSGPSITVNGFGTPESVVIIYVNGPEVFRNTIGANGKFTTGAITLIEGKNILFGKSLDSAGAEVDKTDNYYIMFDKDKPKIEELNLKDGDIVKNLDKRVTITGKISEKATIKINDRLAIQKADNSFEFLLGVDEGEVKIKIDAIDEAGNKETKEFTIEYQKKSF